MYGKVKITRGSSDWGGPLVLEPNETCDKVLCATDGGIRPVAAKTAEMTGAKTVDGLKTTVPDEQVLIAVVDCGGTACCGVHPKKQINAVNLVSVGAVGSLAQYITKGIYASDVKEDTIAFTDEGVKVEKAVGKMEEPGVPKTRAQTEKELAKANQGKKPGITIRIGIDVGQVVNRFFAAGRESIEMAIKNVLPFMAFTSVILDIIRVSGLGNIIADTISSLCSTMPGMIVTSLIYGLPFLPPTLESGAAVVQMVGTLFDAEIGLGSIPVQYILPALLIINTQVGGDFVLVGLSLGEVEPETTKLSTPAVLYSRVTIGPLAVIIVFVLSVDMH